MATLDWSQCAAVESHPDKVEWYSSESVREFGRTRIIHLIPAQHRKAIGFGR